MCFVIKNIKCALKQQDYPPCGRAPKEIVRVVFVRYSRVCAWIARSSPSSKQLAKTDDSSKSRWLISDECYRFRIPQEAQNRSDEL